MNLLRRHAIRAIVGLPLVAGMIDPARAAGLTSVTLRSLALVVPTPPGSQPDVLARWLVEPVAQRMGVAGIVENRPGASGAIAADAVLRASPEAGTLLLGGLDHVAYSHVGGGRRALDPFVDFVPVGVVNRDTWAVVVAADMPTRSLGAMAERARREPLSYASTGEGTTGHLLSARLVRALGIDAQHVPYRDPWLPDLIAGRIHFVVAPTPAVLPQLRAGGLRVLATLTDERLDLPGAPPSVRELGLPGQVFHGGLFLFAPAALATHALRLNATLVDALHQPETVQRWRDLGIEPTPFDLTQTADEVRRRLERVDAMRLAVFGRAR